MTSPKTAVESEFKILTDLASFLKAAKADRPVRFAFPRFCPQPAMKRRLKTAVMLLFVEKSLHRQTRTILIVKANHLDTHRLAFLQVVGDLIDTFVGE